VSADSRARRTWTKPTRRGTTRSENGRDTLPDAAGVRGGRRAPSRGLSSEGFFLDLGNLGASSEQLFLTGGTTEEVDNVTRRASFPVPQRMPTAGADLALNLKGIYTSAAAARISTGYLLVAAGNALAALAGMPLAFSRRAVAWTDISLCKISARMIHVSAIDSLTPLAR
jgi:hypothetical protein